MSDEASGPALSEEERRTIECLLDEVIPASTDGVFPAAGSLGLLSHVERAIARTPILAPVISYGLSAVAELARGRGACEFSRLPKQDRAEIWKEFASTDQFFLPAFQFLAYSGYYQSGRVVEALGLENRPPHPKGYEVGPSDLSLLEPVRRRGKIYREV